MNSIQLPLWVEYVKALGAPAVALVAATIAGWLGFRQWATARNKLKLDFFDRRMTIYTAAVNVIDWLADPDFDDITCISKLREAATSARWLLGRHVSEHISDLAKQAVKRCQEGKPLTRASYEDRETFLQAVRERISERKGRLEQLDKMFDKYLSVKH